MLSLDSCLHLQLLHHNVEQVQLVEEKKMTRDWIVKEFPDLFRGIGYLPGECDIELEEARSLYRIIQGRSHMS